jgi:hypothetical protein
VKLQRERRKARRRRLELMSDYFEVEVTGRVILGKTEENGNNNLSIIHLLNRGIKGMTS